MPTYEYKCIDCGKTDTVKTSINADGVFVTCVCGGMMRKIFSVPAVVFKGSGFYSTSNRTV